MQFDGTLKDSSKEAIYWHQDGDFWGVDKKHIFNCLHTKVIPTTGGNTVVMDLVKAA
jgi:taurine dioxygenase